MDFWFGTYFQPNGAIPSRDALRRVFIGSAAVKRQKPVARLVMKTGGIRRTGAICHPPCQAAQAGSLAHRYAEIKKDDMLPVNKSNEIYL